MTREKSTEDIYLNEIISINNELLSNKIKNHNLFKISAIPEVPEAKQANLDLNIKQKSIMFKFYKSNLTPYRSCARQRSTNYGPEKINKTTQTLETDYSTPNQEISESVIIETKAPVETQFINKFFYKLHKIYTKTFFFCLFYIHSLLLLIRINYDINLIRKI